MRGLWTLAWLEMKIFVREPLGVFATVLVPVATFIVLGRMFGERGSDDTATEAASEFLQTDVPVFAALLIVLSAVVSIVAILSIYRESGILKRLRATPLRPHTIFGAHVIVKLALTAITLGIMALAGRRFYPADIELSFVGLGLALLFTTTMMLSIGFLIASLVPTARFAQPLASLILYPMIALSGLFVPIEVFPAAVQLVARLLPLTYAVSLLEGVWSGRPWWTHATDVGALVLTFVICTVVSSRVFRWD